MVWNINFVFDVPADSSVIEEQLTRPRRETSATSKNGPSKCWKVFPLWNGRFEEGGGGGVGVKKETAIGRFA